jgi:transposase-like protein
MPSRLTLPMAQIAAIYLGGETIANLAADYDTAEATIRRRLIQFGITLRKPGKPHPFSEEKRRRVISAYLEGALPVLEIARVFGLSERSVTRMVAAAGVPRRIRTAVPETTTDEATDLSECGRRLK